MNDADMGNAKLTLTLQGREGAIGIRKNTYRVMGCPRYVSLRVSYRKNSLMLLPCESKDVMSYEAPKNFLSKQHINFRMYSQRFVQDLLRDNRLDLDSTYILTGQFLEKPRTVVFPIDTAVLMNDELCDEQ